MLVLITPQGLEGIHGDLVTMELLVYSCHMEETFTFQQLRDMDDYHKLELIMAKVIHHIWIYDHGLDCILQVHAKTCHEI